MKNGTIYFRDGDLVAKSGEVRVYEMEGSLYMESGRGTLISSDRDLSDYIWQISSKPFGNCLVIGLGLGVASKYILSLPKVTTITTIEESKDVIKTQKEIFPINDGRLKIINTDYLPYLYKSGSRFDFIFVDCYNIIDETTFPLIADIVVACKRRLSKQGVLIGWLDSSTPEVFIDAFYKLFTLD